MGPGERLVFEFGKRKVDPRDNIMSITKEDYKAELLKLQIELVKLQRHIISHKHKVLIIFEGRDAAGKDGTIKRIIEHLSPRETRVMALGKPSEKDKNSWYFQRYVAHLPSAEEIVLMNRSWYNRAGVERVMGFCNDHEYEQFMESVVTFEQMLVKSGIQIIKFYLDISREEQKERLDARREDPLKQWKISPIDEVALEKFDDYSRARDEMFRRTDNPVTPWHIVNADVKKVARLNVIRHILTEVDCPGENIVVEAPDGEIVYPYKR